MAKLKIVRTDGSVVEGEITPAVDIIRRVR